MDELQLKEEIIKKLSEGVLVAQKYGFKKPISSDFVKGFIWGAETMTCLKLTPDMEADINKKFCEVL